MEFMKPKPVERPPPEELAAGIRKRFLVNHNCISCDRPVKYAREEPFPPLPTIRCMPGSKSTRPYTTFELEQIRQHMLPGGLSMTKERFELLEKQRSKLQKEMLRLRLVLPFHLTLPWNFKHEINPKSLLQILLPPYDIYLMNGLQTYLQKGTKILFSCATVDWSGHATRYLHLTWSRNTSSENALRYVAKQRLYRRCNNADLINLLAVSPDGHLNNYTEAIFLWDFVSEWGGSRKKTYYLEKDLYRFQTPDTETD